MRLPLGNLPVQHRAPPQLAYVTRLDEDVHRLRHALVHLPPDLGLTVVEKQVKADQEAVALEQDGMEARVGRVVGR
jgi:hypothetical protein